MLIERYHRNPKTIDAKLEELKKELDLHICSLMRHENKDYEPLVTSDASQQNILISMINRNSYLYIEDLELPNETEFLHIYCLNRNIQVSEIPYYLQLTTNAAYELLAVLKLEGY